MIVWTVKNKSLPSPFTKGPAFRGIWQRGVGGDFRKNTLIKYELLRNLGGFVVQVESNL